MGYEVEITRDPFFSRKGQGPRIHLEEWYDVVHRDEELHLVVPDRPERHPPLFVRWIAHPAASSADAPNWLHYDGLGAISTKYPDEPMLNKMVELAGRLKALVVGDNGELYQRDATGAVVAREEGPAAAPEPALYGHGAAFCRDLTAFVSAHPATGAIPHHTWYLGFLSAFNQARHARSERVLNYSLTPERAAEDQAFLRAYCAEHPDNRFVQAVLALIRMHDLRLHP